MLLYRIIESPRNSWTQKWQTNSNKSKLAIMFKKSPPHDFIRRTLMTRAQLKRALQRANYTKINYIALHSSIEQEWTLLKREQRHSAIADYLSDWLYHFTYLICNYLIIMVQRVILESAPFILQWTVDWNFHAENVAHIHRQVSLLHNTYRLSLPIILELPFKILRIWSLLFKMKILADLTNSFLLFIFRIYLDLESQHQTWPWSDNNIKT